MNTIQITERPDLKTSQIMALLKEKFTVWSYYVDKQLDKDFPAPTEATVAHFLDSQEPDPDTVGLSVNEVTEKYPDKTGITLRQRLLLELAYFEKHGEHLDVKGFTLCSGSRNSNGHVPRVSWSPDGQEVQVSWCSLDYSDAKCGVRSGVSLNPSLPFSLTDEQAISHLKSQGYKITKEITEVKEF